MALLHVADGRGGLAERVGPVDCRHDLHCFDELPQNLGDLDREDADTTRRPDDSAPAARPAPWPGSRTACTAVSAETGTAAACSTERFTGLDASCFVAATGVLGEGSGAGDTQLPKTSSPGAQPCRPSHAAYADLPITELAEVVQQHHYDWTTGSYGREPLTPSHTGKSGFPFSNVTQTS
ncbi:MAG: hypothetical protein QOK20_3486 [Acidimicrobiaceae bacterium]|nr:hypothetical protein [Acidimicrobiaceae bacterium]